MSDIIDKESRLNRSKRVSQDLSSELSSRKNKWHFYTLAILVWATCVLPSTVLFLTVERQWKVATSYTPLTQAIRNALLLITVIFAVYIIIRFGALLLKRPFGIIFLVFSTLIYPLLTGFLHMEGIGDRIIATLVSTAILFATFSLYIKYEDLRILGILGGFTGALALLMALVRPSSAYVIEGGKNILVGPFDNSNYLGICLALLLPFSLLLHNRLNRMICATLMVGLIINSGSNTAIAAALVSVLIVALACAAKNKPSFIAFLKLLAGGSFLLCIMFPYLPHESQAYTGRGIIWIIAQNSFQDYWLFGAGDGWFESISRLAGYRVHNAHNIFLQPLIVGGIFAFSLVAYLIISLLRYSIRYAQKNQLTIFLFVQALLILGIMGEYFLLDVRDLRYFATGFVIITLLSISTQFRNPESKVS